MYQYSEFFLLHSQHKIITRDSLKSNNPMQSMCFIQVYTSIMLAICAYYAVIMFDAFATYYAHNYA